MKRRRVSAAFVELDTADVIRTKDQKECACEAEVFASSQPQNRRSPRLAETTTKVNFQSSKKTSGKKGGQHMGNDNKCHQTSFYNHRADDSSHLTDIAPKPRDTKHAMATRCHKPASRLSSPLAASESVKKNDQQHPTNNHDLICDVKLHSPQGMMVARSASVTTNTEQNPGASSTITKNNSASQSKSVRKEPESTRSSIQGYLIPSRPRRSTRRTHALQKETNVDWSEDLRPTDEDDSLQGCVEGDESRTSVKAELASSKRKRRQRVSKQRNPPALDILGLEVRPNPTDVDDSPDMPEAASFAKQSPRGIDLATNKERRIEISSCSSGANDQPMTEADDEAAGNEQQLRTHDARGRGKTVGQKLAVALRGSKKAYRTRRAFGSRSHPLRASGKASKSQKIVGVTIPRVNSPRITRSQPLMSPTIEVGQTRHIPSNGEVKSAESDPSSLALITGMLSEETLTLADKADLDIHCPSNDRESSNITKLTRPESQKDGAISYKEILDLYPQSLQSSHAKAIDVELPLADNQKEPQLNLSLLESEKGVSSQPSVVSEVNCGTSFRQDPKSEKTPDSQRPLLLTKSGASVPENNLSRRCQRSAQRGCTVDHNGSPRLKSQLTMSTGQIPRHLEMGRIRSRIEISDSSSICSYSSDYDESPEDYSLEHQPVAGPIWTKFQRDMFKEYGIEADELIKQKAKPFLLPGKIPDKACAKSLKGNQQLDTCPLESVPHMGKTSSGEFDENAIQDKSSEGPLRLSGQGSSPTMDEALPCTRVSSKLDPTPITSTMQSDFENVEWTTALKNAQQNAHDQLLETNQHLSVQLAAEQKSVHEVLQIFRQGCNRMFQGLFQAQELRMELYQKQMASIKEQHTEICKDLIRGLQELDFRVQQESESRGAQLPHIP